MKTVNSSQSYQCDSCKGTPVVSAELPSGWKSLRTCLKAPHAKPGIQELDFCATCSAPNNASAAAVLAKLLG
jgi:hypothetical protein